MRKRLHHYASSLKKTVIRELCYIYYSIAIGTAVLFIVMTLR